MHGAAGRERPRVDNDDGAGNRGAREASFGWMDAWTTEDREMDQEMLIELIDTDAGTCFRTHFRISRQRTPRPRPAD